MPFHTTHKRKKRDFVADKKLLLVGNHFLHSHDLNVRFRGDIVGRN